jgi:hypothetical protein
MFKWLRRRKLKVLPLYPRHVWTANERLAYHALAKGGYHIYVHMVDANHPMNIITLELVEIFHNDMSHFGQWVDGKGSVWNIPYESPAVSWDFSRVEFIEDADEYDRIVESLTRKRLQSTEQPVVLGGRRIVATRNRTNERMLCVEVSQACFYTDTRETLRPSSGVIPVTAKALQYAVDQGPSMAADLQRYDEAASSQPFRSTGRDGIAIG